MQDALELRSNYDRVGHTERGFSMFTPDGTKLESSPMGL